MKGKLTHLVKVSGSVSMVYTCEHDLLTRATTKKINYYFMKGGYLTSWKTF